MIGQQEVPGNTDGVTLNSLRVGLLLENSMPKTHFSIVLYITL